MSDQNLDQLLDAEGAARYLGLKVSTIRGLTCTREILCVHPMGKRAVRYRLRDLEGVLCMRSQHARTAGSGR